MSGHLLPNEAVASPACGVLPLLPPGRSAVSDSVPTDGSPPGSAVPGILQARTLEWVAISFSNTCGVFLDISVFSEETGTASCWCEV